MRAVAAAYKKRSLDDFTAALSKYSAQLKADPVIFSHLDALYDGLLEQVAAQTSIPHLARHPNINPSPRPPATLTPVPESHSASRAILQCSGQSRGGTHSHGQGFSGAQVRMPPTFNMVSSKVTAWAGCRK
jgi:hypothetical protein